MMIIARKSSLVAQLSPFQMTVVYGSDMSVTEEGEGY